MRAIKIILTVAAALSLSACGINSIPTREESVKAAWGEVENQYQRRADLIPNLVATVQGFARQEQDVLVGVTEARARATQTVISPGDLSDPARVAAFQQAQDGLSSALSRLMVVVEKYPELKSDQNFLALQSQLEGTENRISIARRDYNESVRLYNTEIRTFPAIFAARLIYGSEPKEPFRATAVDAQTAPEVKF
ncbi:MAG: LemA family protein [Sandarakinorhabdus sp.]|nr:LemA family protein [Sandarakinorhabdus sp.]